MANARASKTLMRGGHLPDSVGSRSAPLGPTEVVQVVALQELVRLSSVVLNDHAVVDKLPEQIPGPLSGGAGQRLPQDEGILVVAREAKRPRRCDGDRSGLAGVEAPGL